MADTTNQKTSVAHIKSAFEAWIAEETIGLESILIINGFGYSGAISVGEGAKSIEEWKEDIKNVQGSSPEKKLNFSIGELEYKLFDPRQDKQKQTNKSSILELKIRDTFLAYAKVKKKTDEARVRFSLQRFLTLAAHDFWQSLINSKYIKKELQKEYESSIKGFKDECEDKENEQQLLTFLTEKISTTLESDRNHLFLYKKLSDPVLNQGSGKNYIKTDLGVIKKRAINLDDNEDYSKKIALYEEAVEAETEETANKNKRFLLLSNANWLRAQNWSLFNEKTEQSEELDLYDYPIFTYLLKEEGIGKGTINFLEDAAKANPRSDDDLIDVIFNIQQEKGKPIFANFELARKEGLKSQMMIALIDEEAEEQYNEEKILGVLKVFSSWSEPLFSFKQNEAVSMVKAASKQLVGFRLKENKKNWENKLQTINAELIELTKEIKSKKGKERKEFENKIKKGLSEKIKYFTKLKRIRKRLGNSFSSKWDYDQLERDLGFQFNSLRNFYLSKIKIENTHFFGNTEWKFDHQMNILVGKNGYGKSFLFRLILAMLTQNKTVIKDYLKLEEHQDEPEIVLDFERSERPEKSNGVAEKLRISRNKNNFASQKNTGEGYVDEPFDFGHIPVLAIPDVRFVRRSKSVPGIGMSLNGELRLIGAKAYLDGEPYHDMIGEFISELCIRYLDEFPKWEQKNKSIENKIEEFFKREAPYNFLQKVVKKLTDDKKFRFVSIDRLPDQNGFDFRVLMHDAHGGPKGDEGAVPIQYLSQGTISVLAIFGIIHRFLKSSHGCNAKKANKMPGLVLIDEVDAHLHPEMQLKVLTLLKKTFPKVQFFISSHSPSIIMDNENVEDSQGPTSIRALMSESDTRGFILKKIEVNDVGLTYSDITKKVFGSQVFDSKFYQMYSKQYDEEIVKLRNKSQLTEDEEDLLEQLKKFSQKEQEFSEFELKILHQRMKIIELERKLNDR